MRIGFVTHEYPPDIIGGAGTYAYRLVTNLAALGHEVVVFAPLSSRKSNNFIAGDRVKVIPVRIPGMPLSMAFFWLKLRGAVRREEGDGLFDVVHINSPTLWFPFRNKISRAPLVLTVHHLYGDVGKWSFPAAKMKVLDLGNENGRFARYIERRCVALSDGIIAVSEYTRGRLEDRYGPLPGRVHVVHEAPEPAQCRSAAPAVDRRQQLSLGPKKALLFVGRINDPRKGLDVLLDALSRIDRDDAVLLIAGRGDPGPVIHQAQRIGIEDKIRMLGFVGSSELSELYELCDLIVVPSQVEGFGLPLLDAAAAGKKVIATRVGAMPEIGGPGAIFIEPNDPDALAKAIEQALDEPGPPADLLRTHASKFNWSTAAELTVQAYEHARSRHRGV